VEYIGGDRAGVVVAGADAQDGLVVLAREQDLVILVRDETLGGNSARGAMCPEFDEGAVCANFLPLRSDSFWYGLDALTITIRL
jgi:hypothetical protein